MFSLSRLMKAGLCGLLMLGMTLPAAATTDTPYLDLSAIEMIESTVTNIVMNDLQTLYGMESTAICVEGPDRALCIHPDTPPEKIDEILRSLPIWEGEGDDRYTLSGRWSSTASGYFGVIAGQPIILSYSFLPDGTWIPSESQSSVLYATLNSQFGGDTEAWKQIFRDNFANWARYVGITYIEEVDDGATFPTTAGVLGVRGDVRMGMASQDGPNGVLAYNWYPSGGGDMVMDADENWTGGTDYRFLRNVVMHEHGHGMGLAHVDASNFQLMEPFYTAVILGPQDDDIRGGNRNYGDLLEENDEAGEATDWGVLGEGFFQQFDVSINATSDTDYYKFTIASGMAIDFTLDPIGQNYLLEGVEVRTDEMMNLRFWLYEGDGTSLIAQTDNGGLGENDTMTDYELDAGTYYVRVLRATGSDVQRYWFSMNLTLNDLTAIDDTVIPAQGMGLSVFPTPFNPKTTARFYVQEAGSVDLQIFNVQGRQVRQFNEEATGAGWMQISWNGRDDSGASVPSGLYFLRANQGAHSEIARALLLK